MMEAVIGPETAFLHRLKNWKKLQEGSVGDFITDAELSEVAGIDCSSPRGLGFVLRARAYIRKNYGRCWERVYGAGGIKCLSFDETIDHVDRSRRAICRKARRDLERVHTIDAKSLDDESQKVLLRTESQLGAMHMFASEKVRKRLELQQSEPLELNKLLDNLVKRNDQTRLDQTGRDETRQDAT